MRHEAQSTNLKSQKGPLPSVSSNLKGSMLANFCGTVHMVIGTLIREIVIASNVRHALMSAIAAKANHAGMYHTTIRLSNKKEGS